MAFKFSTETRRQQCVTGSLKSILDGCVVRLYSGPVPSSADAGLSGNTLLCELTADGQGVTFSSDANGATLTKSLNEIWKGYVLVNGEASFFRMVKPADTGSLSTGEVRIQGTVGGPDADLFITNPVLIQGAPQELDYFAIALLESM